MPLLEKPEGQDTSSLPLYNPSPFRCPSQLTLENPHLHSLRKPTFAYDQPQIKGTTHDLPAQTAPGTLTGDSIVKDLDSEQRLRLFVSASFSLPGQRSLTLEGTGQVPRTIQDSTTQSRTPKLQDLLSMVLKA